ncbi:hypothetical protein CPB85DRAFT_1312011 [Mucidula mucida]|nr:hypothetical protein CPB85DRAFT_1312011 [Mucidula mucida]
MVMSPYWCRRSQKIRRATRMLIVPLGRRQFRSRPVRTPVGVLQWPRWSRLIQICSQISTLQFTLYSDLIAIINLSSHSRLPFHSPNHSALGIAL